MNHPIETKVAAGGMIGLLLGLLFAFVPALRAHISPQLAAVLPPLIGAFAAYLAPHTQRPADAGTIVTDVLTGMDRLLATRLRPAAPPPLPAQVPLPPAVAAAAAAQAPPVAPGLATGPAIQQAGGL